MAVWDTSVASRLHPDEPLFELAAQAALSDQPILLAAATVAEVSFGLQRKVDDERFAAMMSWFAEIFAAGVVGILPLTRESAFLAGRVRAIHPVAPSVAKGDVGPKPERRVAWVADIQIATSAWLAGEGVCTADRGHFDLLGSTIARLYPTEGRLEVLPAPTSD